MGYPFQMLKVVMGISISNTLFATSSVASLSPECPAERPRAGLLRGLRLNGVSLGRDWQSKISSSLRIVGFSAVLPPSDRPGGCLR